MRGKHSGGVAEEFERGERGPKGDHGQTGDIGAVGVRGPQGERGPAAKARWYSLTDGRLLAIFGTVVLVGVLFLHTLSAQQSKLSDAQDQINANLHKIEATRYQSCLAGVNLVIEFNTHQERFKQLTLNRTDLSPQVKQELINAYNASKFEVPNCSKLNPDK